MILIYVSVKISYTCMHVYIYIYIYGEMVDLVSSTRCEKKLEKLIKWNTDNRFKNIFHFFILLVKSSTKFYLLAYGCSNGPDVQKKKWIIVTANNPCHHHHHHIYFYQSISFCSISLSYNLSFSFYFLLSIYLFLPMLNFRKICHSEEVF